MRIKLLRHLIVSGEKTGRILDLDKDTEHDVVDWPEKWEHMEKRGRGVAIKVGGEYVRVLPGEYEVVTQPIENDGGSVKSNEDA